MSEELKSEDRRHEQKEISNCSFELNASDSETI